MKVKALDKIRHSKEIKNRLRVTTGLDNPLSFSNSADQIIEMGSEKKAQEFIKIIKTWNGNEGKRSDAELAERLKYFYTTTYTR